MGSPLGQFYDPGKDDDAQAGVRERAGTGATLRAERARRGLRGCGGLGVREGGRENECVPDAGAQVPSQGCCDPVPRAAWLNDRN